MKIDRRTLIGAAALSPLAGDVAHAQRLREGTYEIQNLNDVSRLIQTESATRTFEDGSRADILRTLTLQGVHHPSEYRAADRSQLFSDFSVDPDTGELPHAPVVPLSNSRLGMAYNGVRFNGGVLTTGHIAYEARKNNEVLQNIQQGNNTAILNFESFPQDIQQIPELQLTALTNNELHGQRGVMMGKFYASEADKKTQKRTSVYLTGVFVNAMKFKNLREAVIESLRLKNQDVPADVATSLIFVPSFEIESMQVAHAFPHQSVGMAGITMDNKLCAVGVTPITLSSYRNGEVDAQIQAFLVQGPDQILRAVRT